MAGSAFAVHVADVQTVHRSGGLVGEDARAVDHLGQLRVCERDLDHDDGVQRGVGIVDAAAGAAGEFLGRTDGRVAGDVQIDVVLVLRIDHQGVGVRAAARLDAGQLLGMGQVADIEDAHAAEPVRAGRRRRTSSSSARHARLARLVRRGSSAGSVGGIARSSRRWRRWNVTGRQRNALRAAIDACAGGFHRHEEEMAVDRYVSLSAGAHHRSRELGLGGIRDVVEVQAVIVADEDVVAAEGQVGVGGAVRSSAWRTGGRAGNRWRRGRRRGRVLRSGAGGKAGRFGQVDHELHAEGSDAGVGDAALQSDTRIVGNAGGCYTRWALPGPPRPVRRRQNRRRRTAYMPGRRDAETVS